MDRQKRLKADPSAYFKAKPKAAGREVASKMVGWQKAGMNISVKRRSKPKGKKGQE